MFLFGSLGGNLVLLRGRAFYSVVEWLKRWTVDHHGLGSKPTCAILLCSWERHFTALSLLGGLDKQF